MIEGSRYLRVLLSLVAVLPVLLACAEEPGEVRLLDAEQRAAVMDLGNRPTPRSEDVASPEAIVQAVYESISGPAEVEQQRDWDRFRSLFLPGARFVLVRWQAAGGEEERVLRAWDVEGFIDAARGFYSESSFYEREVASHVDLFGDIAHVFSTYESRVDSEDSEPVARGINSVQVVRSDDRWWIAHLVWDVERPTNPIPDRPGSGRGPNQPRADSSSTGT